MTPTGERSGEDLAGKDCSTCAANALHCNQHLPLPFNRGILCIGSVPLLAGQQSGRGVHIRVRVHGAAGLAVNDPRLS